LPQDFSTILGGQVLYNYVFWYLQHIYMKEAADAQ
jgi:hypothetical protein